MNDGLRATAGRHCDRDRGRQREGDQETCQETSLRSHGMRSSDSTLDGCRCRKVRWSGPCGHEGRPEPGKGLSLIRRPGLADLRASAAGAAVHRVRLPALERRPREDGRVDGSSSASGRRARGRPLGRPGGARSGASGSSPMPRAASAPRCPSSAGDWRDPAAPARARRARPRRSGPPAGPRSARPRRPWSRGRS